MDLSGNVAPLEGNAAFSQMRPQIRRAGSAPVDTGPSFEQSLQEAENRPLDFPAAERAAYVRAMVARIKELQRAGRTANQIQELLPEFGRDYPQLFKMLTESEGADITMLNTMLGMLDRMGRGDLTPHQASVAVGQKLLQRYGGGPSSGQ